MAATARPNERKRWPVHDLQAPEVVELHAGSVVALAEWRCPGHDRGAAAAEIGDTYEVVVARRGVFARESDGHRVVSDAGTATFWHPGEPYRITHPVPGGDCCSIVGLSAAGVRALVSTVDPARAEAAVPRFPAASVTLSGPSYLVHRLAMAAARDAARPGGTALGTSPLRAEEYAVAFAASAVTAAAQSGAGKSARPFRDAVRNWRGIEYAARVREYIAPRYRQPLTLRDIATAVGCSPYHLSRLVSATSGVPIYGLVIRLRLRHALELLLETRDDISAIAFDAGFASHSHFSDAFRREFGLPPGAVRRRHGTALRALMATPRARGPRPQD